MTHSVPTQINFLLLIDHLKIISTYNSLSLHEYNTPLFVRKSIVKDIKLVKLWPFLQAKGIKAAVALRVTWKVSLQ